MPRSRPHPGRVSVGYAERQRPAEAAVGRAAHIARGRVAVAAVRQRAAVALELVAHLRELAGEPDGEPLGEQEVEPRLRVDAEHLRLAVRVRADDLAGVA